MASNAPTGRGIISGINVTPLVDIVLVLLIIFIVTAKIVVAPAVPVDLPQATQGEAVQVIFSVLVAKDGTTMANGTRVADDRILEERAREELASDHELRAVIQADGDVPHRRIIAVLDTLKRAGVTRIAFGTSAPPATSRNSTPDSI